MAASIRKHHLLVKWLVKAGADTAGVVTTASAAGIVTAAEFSRYVGASAEQTSYLEAKTHCSRYACSGAGLMKCTGCKQARYCGKVCQLAHWKAHKSDCRQWSAELTADKGKRS
jgi:hypothetical protein